MISDKVTNEGLGNLPCFPRPNFPFVSEKINLVSKVRDDSCQ